MVKYVGARYMPKFMGDYDPTVEYEALSVVDNGSGTSYVSNKPVPAGTPLTNTAYWAVYGTQSGAIIHLQDQIGDLSQLTTEDNDSLVEAINELDADIQILKNDTPIINVMSFGAVGDGVTDDYSAFEDAVTYCIANNVKMYVPHGSYKLSQYIFTDEDYIYSDLGTYVDAKLVYSKSMEKGSLHKLSTTILDVTTVFGAGVELQTVIWNDTLGCYTYFGWDGEETPDSSTATITNVDTSGNVINRTTKAYGLINDAIYYPVDNTILITGSNSGNSAWHGKIVKLNASDFSVIDTYDSGVEVIYEIGYDSDNAIVYTAGRKYGTQTWQLAILDTDLNILKQYPNATVVIPPYTDSGRGFTYEGSCMINGQFMIQSFNANRIILSSYNLENGTIKNYIVIPREGYIVPENAFIKDGALYIASYKGDDIILDKYELNIIDGFAYLDNQIGQLHQQTKTITSSAGTYPEIVKDYADGLTFNKGFNIANVLSAGGNYRGTFLMSMANSGNGLGIFIGYYTDYVFRVKIVNDVRSVKQLDEVS